MQVISDTKTLQSVIAEHKKRQKKIALVPTMGALHEGHLKLIDRAKTLGDLVVVSIFVNPAQFAPNEDYEKYPREFESDCQKCENRGADFVFAPRIEDMYPNGFDTKINCGEITTLLEGAARPGHFDGVCTVVLKLFNVSLADFAVFGQKDAQQVMVIKQMVRDLNAPIIIDVHPIVREDDGLAKSSRNAYLTANERAEVYMIYEGLVKLSEFSKDDKNKNSQKLKEFLQKYYLSAKYFSVEYIAITDFSARKVDGNIFEKDVLISLAVRTTQSKTRLIDNVVINL
ncbi:MAG: pantoate--beta-alanine ligase [Chitinispirillales bacterium]|jgi:pantoate--beta-alanine ligase|nr:pantoate--beta-alanine ligase [Chitinispirillales bacterium]